MSDDETDSNGEAAEQAAGELDEEYEAVEITADDVTVADGEAAEQAAGELDDEYEAVEITADDVTVADGGGGAGSLAPEAGLDDLSGGGPNSGLDLDSADIDPFEERR